MNYVKTIHVIDDDAMTRDSLHILLGSEGYIVHTHESAEGFLNTIEKGDAGCIVTDVNMPGIFNVPPIRPMRHPTSRGQCCDRPQVV